LNGLLLCDQLNFALVEPPAESPRFFTSVVPGRLDWTGTKPVDAGITSVETVVVVVDEVEVAVLTGAVLVEVVMMVEVLVAVSVTVTPTTVEVVVVVAVEVEVETVPVEVTVDVTVDVHSVVSVDQPVVGTPRGLFVLMVV